jgi:hypothetical protein
MRWGESLGIGGSLGGSSLGRRGGLTDMDTRSMHGVELFSDLFS